MLKINRPEDIELSQLNFERSEFKQRENFKKTEDQDKNIITDRLELSEEAIIQRKKLLASAIAEQNVLASKNDVNDFELASQLING